MTSRIQYNNPKNIEAFGLAYHYEMVSDRKRVAPLKKAIEKVCSDKIVLECGTGSGILSILAARAGAKKVYAVEKDPEVFTFARNNIQKNGFHGIIQLIQKDIKQVTIQDLDCHRADVVIAENLSTWQVTEPQIPIMNYINNNLVKENGIVIPNRIFNNFELAQSQYIFEKAVEVRTYYFEFTGIISPQLLSKPINFSLIDLKQANASFVDKTVIVRVSREGILNSIRLTSPIEIHDDIHFLSSDSLMPPVIIPLEEDLKVEEYDLVKIRIQYCCPSDWKQVKCEAWRVNGAY